MERAVRPLPIVRDRAVATERARVTDDQLLALWLHGRPKHTLRAYARDAGRFRAFVAKPLQAVTLGDVQAFADTLAGHAPATQGRALGGEIAARLRAPARLPAVRCRARGEVARDQRDAGGAHPR